jgi:enoyl-CoA hydratase
MLPFYRAWLSIRRLEVPTIAAVNGPAIGAGLCLALACDLRYAAAGARLGAPFVRLGMHAGMGGTWLLPDVVGEAAARDLLLTGRVVDAAEALSMGLVSRVLPDDELLDACLEVAEAMTRFSPYGLAMTKDVLWANLEVASLEAAVELEDRNQLMLGFTENLPEAIRAFDQGRPPVYTDEPRRGMFPEG